ncbi:MAG: molybdopterin-dependent oxidoreductase, partial [Deltaproteobacteria bacterium]|nr:molybdopterin-dependent oxidoreductase [Deltaproteobacteria bacterium]
EYLHHPHRLKHPLKREGERGSGSWRKVSWDEALEEISIHLNKIKSESGAESVAFVHGAAKGLQESYLSRLANVFGTPNVAWQGHVCFLPRVLASRITYGFYAVPDYDYQPSCIMVWGKNLDATLHHAYKRVIDAVEKGSKLLVVDPRETELTKKADLWLQPRPGSDLALALGMLYVIIHEELIEKGFVEKWTIGFDRLKDHILDYPPERIEEITWVPAEKLRQAARIYAEHSPSCIQWGNAIDHGLNSFQNARAICILRAITGNLGAPGGEIQPLSLPLFGRRSSELELIEKMPPDTWEKRVGAEMKGLPMIRYVQPQSIIKAIIDQDPYPIRGLYIQGANPLLSYPNAQKTYKAFMKVDFSAVADMFMTPTAALADMVLPVASYLEFDSIVTPPYSYPMTIVQQKVTRVGECRSDYEILAGLAKKLDLGEYFWDSEEKCLDFVLRPAGLSFEEFKRIAIIPGSLQYRRYKEKGFETPSGKVEIYSHRLEEWGFDPLPTYQEPPETPYSEQALAEEYPLILTTWKSAPFRHSGGRQVNTLRGEYPEPVVYIHPETAGKADINDGDLIYIETIRGRIKQKARLTKGIDPKVIGVDYAWWFPEKDASNLYGWAEANVNILVDDKPPYSPEMGTTNLRGSLCKISKVGDNHDLFRHATI